MSVEQRCCFLSALANFLWRKSLGRHPNDFRDRRRHERLDPVEALDNAMAAPAVEQRLPILTGRNVSQHVANFIGIKDARCVAMRIEKDQCVLLIEIDVLRQPVKRAGVIVLDVNGQNACPCG
ncbi:MAG: hypothetical protein DMF02_04340 [Verrucomicrobia bacterium]|nr:MAG: hypothetical protein DMF02_04340 [Verrucomicrobiota bacterium]